MGWEFEEVSYFFLMVFIPFLAWRILYLYQWKKNKMSQFADSATQKRIFGTINTYKFFRDNIWIILVFMLMVLGLINLLGGVEKKEMKREGIDMVFVIDVSGSMDAEDILPSRLEKGKKIVSDLITKLGGDRVGIVIFAGQAYKVMPLSNDYSAADLYLRSVDTGVITNQGTNIADAVTEASGMLSTVSNTSKAIIVISDGETHKGDIDKAIHIAKKNNVNIFSIGLGKPKGIPIPTSYGYKTDENGDIVVTRLEDTTLKKMTMGTQGAYFWGGGTTEDIANQVFNSLSSLDKNEQATSYTYEAKSYYQIFTGLALLLLIVLSLTNYKRDFNV